MIEIIVGAIAVAMISGIAVRKGFRGPGATLLAALSFPVGVLVGAVGYILATGDPNVYDDIPGQSHLPLIFQEPAYAIPTVVGVVFLSLVLIFIVRAKPRPTSQARHETRVPYWLIGLVWTGLGLLIIFITVDAPRLIVFVSYAVALGAFHRARNAFHLAKQARATSAEEALRRDSRPPVLLLRSFSADGLPGLPYDVRVPPFDWMPGVWTFEEALGPVIKKRLGPIVALGNPNDDLPGLGAARTYPDNAEWPQVFQTLADQSVCVLIVPGTSKGLLEEFRYTRDALDPRKVFLLIGEPQGAPEEAASLWTEFVDLMKGVGIEVPSEPPASASILGFGDDWSCTYVGRGLASENEYVSALERALGDASRTEYLGTAKPDVDPRQTRAYKLGRTLRKIFPPI